MTSMKGSDWQRVLQQAWFLWSHVLSNTMRKYLIRGHVITFQCSTNHWHWQNLRKQVEKFMFAQKVLEESKSSACTQIQFSAIRVWLLPNFLCIVLKFFFYSGLWVNFSSWQKCSTVKLSAFLLLNPSLVHAPACACWKSTPLMFMRPLGNHGAMFV